MPSIPCFLSSDELEQRTDKNGNPYFTFVRGSVGQKNLAQLIATLEQQQFPFQKHARVLHEIQAVLTEIRGVEREVADLDGIFNILKPSEYKDRARDLLHKRIETLLDHLAVIAAGKTS